MMRTQGWSKLDEEIRGGLAKEVNTAVHDKCIKCALEKTCGSPVTLSSLKIYFYPHASSASTSSVPYL